MSSNESTPPANGDTPPPAEKIPEDAPPPAAKAPEEAPPAAVPAAPGRPRAGLPVLRLARPFAAIAVVGVLLGRAVGPSMEGLAVGLGKVISAVERAGWIGSQVLGVAAIVVAVALILAVSRGRTSAAVRLAAVGPGAAVVSAVFLASPRREMLPGWGTAVLASAAILVALTSAESALRAPITRAAGLVLGLVGVGSLLRLLAVGVAVLAETTGGSGLAAAARGAATAGFLVGALGIAVAVAWIASRGKKLASPVTLAVMGAGLFLTMQAMKIDRDESGVLPLLVHRAAEHLLTKPEPLLPRGFQIFVALLAPLGAIAALLSRGVPAPSGDRPGGAAVMPPAVGASIALALLVRDAPDMPLGALCLVIAGLTASLAASDDRGVWDAIVSSSAPRRTG